jgi:hypothetical protein
MEVHLEELLSRRSEITLRDNMEVQLAKLFLKQGVNLVNLKVVAV